MPDNKNVIREDGVTRIGYSFKTTKTNPTDPDELASKQYVDNTAGGTPEFATLQGQPNDNENLAADLGAKLDVASNLSDVADPAAAAANLGALKDTNNLSDVDDAPTAAANLGKNTDTTLGGVQPDPSDTAFPSQKAVRDFISGHYWGFTMDFGGRYGAVGGENSNQVADNVEISASSPYFPDPDHQPQGCRRLEIHGASADTPIHILGTDVLGGSIDIIVTADGDTEQAFAYVNNVETDSVDPFTISIGQSETLGFDHTVFGNAIEGFVETGSSVYHFDNFHGFTFDPNDVSKNTWHWESYPTPADMKLHIAVLKSLPVHP